MPTNNDGVQIKDIAGIFLDKKRVEANTQIGTGEAYVEGYNKCLSEISGKRIGINAEKLKGIVSKYKYGVNWCNNENRERDPNSIGRCDYCGGVVRLRHVEESILASQSQIIECKE